MLCYLLLSSRPKTVSAILSLLGGGQSTQHAASPSPCLYSQINKPNNSGRTLLYTIQSDTDFSEFYFRPLQKRLFGPFHENAMLSLTIRWRLFFFFLTSFCCCAQLQYARARLKSKRAWIVRPFYFYHYLSTHRSPLPSRADYRRALCYNDTARSKVFKFCKLGKTLFARQRPSDVGPHMY